jgi:5'-nucleotidase
MRLLVTNDDGIYSPGLLALAEAAAEFGAVYVVAPNVEQSSASHAITAARPLSWSPSVVGSLPGFRVNGTPADCVALGLSQWKGVDVVLSGINLGLNLGNAMWHSGTLAAAKQAALLGVRGIAFSAPIREEKPSFERIKPALHAVLQRLLPDGSLSLVNVNFPSEPAGICWTRQAVRHYDGYVVPGRDPTGREHFWYVVRPIDQVEENTDLWAVRNSWVSLTPLRLDLTDHEQFARMGASEPPLRSDDQVKPKVKQKSVDAAIEESEP